MLEGKVGILRTMPAPDERSLGHFRRQTARPRQAVGRESQLRRVPAHAWTPPTRGSWPSCTRPACCSAAPATPRFDGSVPEDAIQSAIGAAYAHTTAPLRRLVDRFVLVICEALSNGKEVPGLGPGGAALPAGHHGRLGPAGRRGWSGWRWTPWRRRCWSTTSARSSTPSSFPVPSPQKDNGNGERQRQERQRQRQRERPVRDHPDRRARRDRTVRRRPGIRAPRSGSGSSPRTSPRGRSSSSCVELSLQRAPAGERPRQSGFRAAYS